MKIDFLKKHLSLITTVLVIITGVAFIVSAICICLLGGERPYSRETVADCLALLTVPSLLTLASVVSGLILKRGEAEQLSSPSLVKVTLKRLSARVDLEKCDTLLREKIYKERLSRKMLCLLLTLVVFSASLAAILYITLVAELTKENLNSDVASAMLVVLPLAAVSLGSGAVAVHRLSESYSGEMALVKSAIVRSFTSTESIPEEKLGIQLFFERRGKKILLSVRATLLLLSFVFIIAGVVNGGMGDVLGKAIRICTECIGLG